MKTSNLLLIKKGGINQFKPGIKSILYNMRVYIVDCGIITSTNNIFHKPTSHLHEFILYQLKCI